MHGVLEEPRGTTELVEFRQGPCRFRNSRIAVTVSVKLSPTGAQPGMFTTGSPNRLRYSLPRKSMTLIAPVGLPSAAGIPPHVAHVPIAITAAAPGARRRTHSEVGTRRRSSNGAHVGTAPSAAQGSPCAVRCSSGTEPS
jgi:hypothetical protein